MSIELREESASLSQNGTSSSDGVVKPTKQVYEGDEGDHDVDGSLEGLKSVSTLVKDRAPLSRQMKIHYAFFTLVYFVLGLAASYEVLTPLYLSVLRGVPEGQVSGGLAIARIPILFRILIGVMGDKLNLFGFGHRKPYITVGIVLSIVAYVSLGILELNHESFSTESFTVTYFALFFIAQLVTTIHDAAGDGFLTEGIPKNRAGHVQGIINCGRGFGSVVGFVVFGFLGDGPGWHVVHFLLAGIFVLLAPFTFFLKEVPEEQREQFQWRAFRIFKQRKIQVACVFVFMLNIPSAMALFLIPLFTEEFLGFGTDLSSVILGVAAVFVAVGAPVAGYFMDKYRAHLVWVFTGAVAFGAIATGGFIVAGVAPDAIWIFAVLGGLFIGAMLALVFALTMVLADDSISGSFFAILDTIWTAGELVSLGFIGSFLETYGYLWSWALTCLFTVILIPIVQLMFRVDGGAQKAMTGASTSSEEVHNYDVEDVVLDDLDDDDDDDDVHKSSGDETDSSQEEEEEEGRSRRASSST